MRRENAFITVAVCLTIVAAGAIVSHAGPLDPPGGPVSSTYKTLDEVEPRIPINASNTPGNATATFRIAQPGSYYLPESFTATPAKSGLFITADNVTIDLQGFTIDGNSNGTQGINIADGRKGVTIHSGAIVDFTSDGVRAPNAIDTHLRDLVVDSVGGAGIDIGNHSIVETCRVRTAVDGILAAKNAIIRDCSVSFCSSNGITTGTGATITGCTSEFCTLDGISANQGSTISWCTASTNSDAGIVGLHSSISNCSAFDNGDDGFVASGACTLSNCSAVSNVGDGFLAGTGAVIRDCAAQDNGDDGFSITADCLVSRCTADSNEGAGIHVPDGIITTNSDNRVEHCNVTDNAVGIWVEDPGNFIISNVASGNGDPYNFSGGNTWGQIIDLPGGLVLTNQSGYANFSH